MFIIFNYKSGLWKRIGTIRTTLHVEKQHYLPRYWSDKGFKGTVVNREFSSLHGGSSEITLTAH